MDMRDVLQATARYWWLVVAVAMAALGCAVVVNAVAVPQYATTVVFFVTTPSEGVSESYQGGLFSQQRVRSYEHLLTGDKLAHAIAGADGVGLTPAEVQSRISSWGVDGTVLLRARATDTDPARSERIANVLAREFISLVEEIETPPDRSSPAVKVEVVEGPAPSSGPVSPKPVRNFAIAGLLGLLLGVMAALLRRALDVTVKTAEVLQRVTGAPVLAVVPFDSGMKRHTPLVAGSRVAEGAAKRSRSHSARGEAFRHLRTNLQFLDVDDPPKVIVITSAVVGEGKSSTAVNTAIAFAEAGRAVALVEADLRRPRVAAYLGVEGGVGLSDVLAGRVRVEDVLQRWGRNDLHVLPSGFMPPKPSELLGSQSMVALLGRLRERFDVVIVDSPPLLPFTDAAVVAASADGAVVVVRSGKTHQARVRTAVARIEAVGARLLGSVLNMQATKVEEGYYYHGYRYRDSKHTPQSLTAQLPSSGPAHASNGRRTDWDQALGAGR